jgi:hypothetical protein
MIEALCQYPLLTKYKGTGSAETTSGHPTIQGLCRQPADDEYVIGDFRRRADANDFGGNMLSFGREPTSKAFRQPRA